MRSKTCTFCGDGTLPQIQDDNRDKGYGYCEACVGEDFIPVITGTLGDLSFHLLRDKRDKFTYLIRWQTENSLRYNMRHFDNISKALEYLSRFNFE